MKIAELSAKTLEKIRAVKYDRIVERHEGPESWGAVLEYGQPDFIEVDGHWVLLPIDRDHHPNITALRFIAGDQGDSLTLFLKDTTHVEDPAQEKFHAGFLAVCDRVEGEEFFIAIVYHEWFIIGS